MRLDEAKKILKSNGYLVEDTETNDEDTLKTKSRIADNFIHTISNDIDKYFSGRSSKYFKYYEIEIMRQIMASVYEYAQRMCELNGNSCNLETLKQVIKDAYDENYTGK